MSNCDMLLLSYHGQREINRYSYGGFDVLTEWIDDAGPRNVEVFLAEYKKLIDEKLGDYVVTNAPSR